MHNRCKMCQTEKKTCPNAHNSGDNCTKQPNPEKHKVQKLKNAEKV